MRGLIRALKASSAAAAVLLGSIAAVAHGQEIREINVKRTPTNTRLVEVLSVGSLDGPNDSFDRIMDGALDSRGRLFVADDLSRSVKVFDSDGRFVQAVGRLGDGPGEFRSPWGVAVDQHDSLYVWDSVLGRISVFSPSLAFARSIRVSPAWIVTSLLVPLSGRLILAAFAVGDHFPIKILDGTGRLLREAGPRIDAPHLSGFEGSLLGGYLTRVPEGYAYTQKSPYAITFFDEDMRPMRICKGAARWTTDPTEVVRETSKGTQLEWNRFRHSASIVPLPGGLLLNTILDPMNDTRTLQIVNEECEILGEIPLSAPVLPLDARKDRILAVRSLDYPEIVVYQVRSGN